MHLADSFSKKKLKKEIKYFLYSYFHWYKGKNVAVHLQGGLCNKLHCFFSACDLAINEKCFLIEPYFGWSERILFSEIYDLPYFNERMRPFAGGRNILVSRREACSGKGIDNVVDLWGHSERELYEQRKSAFINHDSTKLNVLRALRLRPKFQKIVDVFKERNFTALQVRTESDWVKHAINEKPKQNEKILVPMEDILDMLRDFKINGRLFFTSGENQEQIKTSLKAIGIDAHYFYDPSLEYDTNAAINFEICCKAEYFIGLSRSSYSNLISLKRAAILNKDQSYIYNYKNRIFKRIDKGIQIEAESSVTKETEIV